METNKAKASVIEKDGLFYSMITVIDHNGNLVGEFINETAFQTLQITADFGMKTIEDGIKSVNAFETLKEGSLLQ